MAASWPVDGALPPVDGGLLSVDGGLFSVDGVLLLGNGGGVGAVLVPAVGDPGGKLTALCMLVALGGLDLADCGRLSMARRKANSPSSLLSRPTSIADWRSDWRTLAQRLLKMR